MILLTVVAVTGLGVSIALLTTCMLCTSIDQLERTSGDLRRRATEIAPYVVVAAVLFLLKLVTNDLSLVLSETIDWNVTDTLYAVEGLFVAHLQNLVPDAAYGFFSVMYMFGFPYLLLVPIVLYFLLPTQNHLKKLFIAYVLNYTVGAISYTVFIAYGPRNWISEHVNGTMYQLYPETQELTAAVSDGSDVFPSLHTSMAIIVLLFAWQTRRAYPRWFNIAAFVSTSVVLSTMVLGIHWVSDVVAGVALGTWCVVTASWIVERVDRDSGTNRSVDETSLSSEVDD